MATPQADQSPASMLRQAASGDADAWRALVTGYTPRVYALLVSQCRDRDLAEEITQQAFVKIVDRIGDYEEQGRFESWLFRIAMNALRDEMRRRKRQASPMDMTESNTDEASPWHAAQQQVVHLSGEPDAGPLDRMTHEEQLEQLRVAVARLPEADQEIIRLRHTAGLSFAQIAEALDQPLGTVLARGHRALGKLKKMLAMPDGAASA